MALLRCGASVVGYEIREDFAARARANVAALGVEADYRVVIRDVTEGIDETGLDRVVLDLPEPWRVLPHAATALRPGGILLAYLPTINQTAQLRGALEHARSHWRTRSRSCGGPGTSRRGPCDPTTAWSATPVSSPPLAGWRTRTGGTRPPSGFHRPTPFDVRQSAQPMPRTPDIPTPQATGARSPGARSLPFDPRTIAMSAALGLLGPALVVYLVVQKRALRVCMRRFLYLQQRATHEFEEVALGLVSSARARQ